MRRHFRKRPNPCCCTMFKYREQTLVLTLLVSTSFEYFFTSLFSCLPPLAGDMMNMQMSDRSSCIGPMSCLQPPSASSSSHSPIQLISLISIGLILFFGAVIPRVILVIRVCCLTIQSDDPQVSCLILAQLLRFLQSPQRTASHIASYFQH